MSVMVYVYGHRSHSACSRGVPSYVWLTDMGGRLLLTFYLSVVTPSKSSVSRSAAAPRRKKCVVNTWKHVEGRKVRYDKIRYKINTYAVAWLVWCCHHLTFSVNLVGVVLLPLELLCQLASTTCHQTPNKCSSAILLPVIPLNNHQS